MTEPEVTFPIVKGSSPKKAKKRKTPSRENGLATWKRTQKWVMSRANDHCEARIAEVCTFRAVHVHHVVLRSRGGSDDPSNLMAVCNPCHTFIHHEPDWATEHGFMRSGWAAS